MTSLPDRDPPPVRTAALDPLRHLEDDLADLDRRGLLRLPPEPVAGVSGAPLLVLCSNDYLGYAAEPWPAAAASGSGASRLVTGEHPAHAEAEGAIAGWLGAEASLLFTSGYAANAGALAALARPGDLVLSDARNHASIIDGCRLSGARVVVFPHLDLAAVERALAAARRGHGARVWVVTETLFSMDGDTPDLGVLRALCDVHDAALYVDEAHAVGVLGPEGRGLCAEVGIRPDVLVGTLGKALGLQGAFVAGSRVLRTYLWNRARSFVFSTGVSPALAARVADNVRRAAGDDAARARLHENAARLRQGLTRLGLAMPAASRGPILPWVVGSASEAVGISMALREDGILVQPIRPPTVPLDTSRLRITATATLTGADIDRALRSFARFGRAG